MGRCPATNDWRQGAGRDACVRPRYLERLCAEARAGRRRRCAVVGTSGRRCPRGQVGSGVRTGPSAARGHAQPRSFWASRERAKPLSLSPRAVRERANPLSRRGPGPALQRSGARRPASFSRLILFHHPCYDPPLLLPPAFRDCPPQPRDFSLSPLETNVSHFASCRHLEG